MPRRRRFRMASPGPSWPFRVVDEFEEIVAASAPDRRRLGELGRPLPLCLEAAWAWAGEVAILAFAWVIFLGAAPASSTAFTPALDMLVTRLPTALARGVNLFAHLCVIACAC